MATHAPLLPKAIIENIEVEDGIEDGMRTLQLQYTIRVYEADKKVTFATSKSQLLVLKWEWNTDNEIWYEPLSTMKVVIYHEFDTKANLLSHLVGQHEGKVVDMLENNAKFDLTDRKCIPVPMKMKIALSPVSELDDYIKEFMARVDIDIACLMGQDIVPSTHSILGQVLKSTKAIMD